MFERISEDLRLVLFKSRSLAEEYSTASIGAEHLLLAALTTSSEISNGQVQLAANLDGMIPELQKSLKSQSHSEKAADVQFSSEAKEAIRIAGDYGWEQLPAKTRVWQLLLGISSQEDSAAAALLRAHGLSRAQLETLAASAK